MFGGGVDGEHAVVMTMNSSKGKKRKDYGFWRQFNEKPRNTPGCPGQRTATLCFATSSQA